MTISRFVADNSSAFLASQDCTQRMARNALEGDAQGDCEVMQKIKNAAAFSPRPAHVLTQRFAPGSQIPRPARLRRDAKDRSRWHRNQPGRDKSRACCAAFSGVAKTPQARLRRARCYRHWAIRLASAAPCGRSP